MLGLPLNRGDCRRGKIHVALDQHRQHGAIAAVRQMLNLQLQRFGKILHRQMRKGTESGVAEYQLLFPRGGEQIIGGLEFRVRADRNREDILENLADVLERVGVVANSFHQMGRVGDRRGWSEAENVPVGRRLRELAEAYRTGSAFAVDDDDVLPELLRERGSNRAADDVDAAACRECNDHLDVSRGIFLLCVRRLRKQHGRTKATGAASRRPARNKRDNGFRFSIAFLLPSIAHSLRYRCLTAFKFNLRGLTNSPDAGVGPPRKAFRTNATVCSMSSPRRALSAAP